MKPINEHILDEYLIQCTKIKAELCAVAKTKRSGGGEQGREMCKKSYIIKTKLFSCIKYITQTIFNA